MSVNPISASNNQQQDWQYLMDVEGECRISSIEAIKLNYLKAIPVILLSVFLIIPGIILLNFKKVRKYLLYTTCDFAQADHLYVEAHDGNFDICPISRCDNGARIFMFLQLRYQLSGKNWVPMVLDYSQFLKSQNLKQSLNSGLSTQQKESSQKWYGLNEHEIEIQSYPAFMLSTVFKPLYILQYIVVLSLSVQGLPMFGIILVAASWITTSGNYVAIYIGKRKIKQMAKKMSEIDVRRNGDLVKVQMIDLVPGDIIVIQEQSDIPCDCILLQGEVFINQCSLTGENIPIKKTAYKEDYKNGQIWLYDGTKVLQYKNSLAVVIFTGFASKKGRLLRKILNRVPIQPDFFIKMFFFLLESFVVAMCLYGATLPIRLTAHIDHAIVVLRIMDYLTSSIPPAFPIYFAIAESWSLYRLKKKRIFSTMLEKTVQSNRVNTVCFDKTGTLTQNNLSLKQLYIVENEEIKLFDLMTKQPKTEFIKLMLGTCHTVRKINGQYQGDEVDLKIWEASGFKPAKNSLDEVVSEQGQSYSIVTVNQFESKFQSMSVMVKQNKSGKHFVFVKGAPQKIHSCSVHKIQQFSRFVQNLSFRGLRTIAFGWKQINQNEVQRIKTASRDEFLSNIALIGLAGLQNPLHSCTQSTIETLQTCSINTRMITGDNIHIAVEVGFQSGIISKSDSILIVQGKKYEIKNGNKVYITLEVGKRWDNSVEQVLREYAIQQILDHQGPVAVDGDFLNSDHFQMRKQFKIFARILPDKKAYIVRQIKQQFENEYNSLGCCPKYFGQGRKKICMVGDGANDLMAIKQADVGIGINNGTDAVYSSAFTICSLSDVINVFKEGKCTTLNILECLKFTLIANYVNLVVEILTATQATFLSQNQVLYNNFLIIILMPVIMPLSGPNNKLYERRVKDNFLCWQNQLSMWGSIVILSVGLVGSYFYITSQPYFVPNPDPYWRVNTGYNYNCQLVTCMFVGEGLILSLISFIVSQSYPLKQKFYKNIPMLVITTINFIAFTVYFFVLVPSGLNLLNLLPISKKTTGIEYAIIMASITCAFLFNLLLHKLTNRVITKQVEKQSLILTSNSSNIQIKMEIRQVLQENSIIKKMIVQQ